MLKNISISINKPHIILIEGVDAKLFFIPYLDFAIKQNKEYEKFWLYDYGGINDLNMYLSLLKKVENFDKVQSICIIRDAETSASNACDSIKYSLTKAGLACPDGPFFAKCDNTCCYPKIKTGFVLFPECGTSPINGTLENLCLNQLSDNNAKTILQDVEPLLEKYKSSLPRLHKNRLHSYFSLTDRYVSLKIGEATQANAFKFTGGAMDNLKNFLDQFIVK